MSQRKLCRLDELVPGASRGFAALEGQDRGCFVVRRGDAVYAYRNACPHTGAPLEWLPDRFLDSAGEQIICALHGAKFRIEDGECVFGPCVGDALQSLPVSIVGGDVYVEDIECSQD